MAINWTPWLNVPTHRRLELFSIGFLMFISLGFIPFGILLIAYTLVIGVSTENNWKIYCF